MNKLLDPIEEFEIYNQKIGSREKLYKLIQLKFDIKSAVYPGSYIDIEPSFFIEDVVYIDNFAKSNIFFSYIDEIKKYINKNKFYQNEPKIKFIYDDYTKATKIEKVDLIISQFAGFVGQATKYLLKDNGIFLCNDSHGDATLAYLDNDFQLIGVTDSEKIVTEDLNKYFKLKDNRKIDKNKVLNKMKGLNYIYNPSNNSLKSNYIFKKVKN